MSQTGVHPGKVWLVGAGPGDIELLTFKAARVIGLADVILVDDLVNPEALRFAAEHADVQYVGKRGGRCSTAQADIQTMMADLALAGKTVIRLKGGDPLIFGRAHEELRYLHVLGIEVEIVNGLTSGMVAATCAGIPLTDRLCCHGVTFVTAHTQTGEPPNWQALARSETTLVVYMGISQVQVICSGLLQGGMPAQMPVVVIQSASLPTQKIVHCALENLAESVWEHGLSSPAIIIIGEVARVAEAGEDMLHVVRNMLAAHVEC